MIFTSSWILPLFLSFGTSLFILYKYSTRKFDYWAKRGVYCPTPIPIFGNFISACFFRYTIGEWLKRIYDTVNAPYFGLFIFDEPILIMKSPELIKNIAIRDFAYFVDRTVACPMHDNIQSNMLFFQKTPVWRSDRVKLTPVFTSGKLKGMFPIVNSIGEDLVRYLSKHKEVLNAKEVCSKYSTDVSAKCFFGINSHCFDNDDATFRKIGFSIFHFNLRNAFVQMAYFFRPRWVDLFHLDFIPTTTREYFSEAVKNTIKEREKSKIRKNDFVDILKDLEESDGHVCSTDSASEKIIGQALQFYAAGFETTSSTIAFTLHELCLNPSIQNKLRNEVRTNIKENKGITYEGIQDMKYLSMCINETLRKYPVLPFLDRTCNEDYKVPETDFVIEKGTPVFIPIYGLQMDEKYFPSPAKYDPERFSDSKLNENGLIYMPFGDGPRSCIGERFGLMASKLALLHILLNFEVEKCDKTPNPVEFATKSFVLQSKIGLPMIFKKIVPNPA
nr:cytochrome P450 6k1-like [Leptinotarsa decemlineata]